MMGAEPALRAERLLDAVEMERGSGKTDAPKARETSEESWMRKARVDNLNMAGMLELGGEKRVDKVLMFAEVLMSLFLLSDGSVGGKDG